MLAITRTPRLLVKLAAAPPKASFDFGAKTISASFERLFDSIRPARAGLAAKQEPEWYILTPSERAAEVNAWDLCHHLTRQGFGVAGLAVAQFAEPDLEQQWVTGTAVEHAMAVSKSCDKPSDPESRLPPIPFTDPFWFRDAKHSAMKHHGQMKTEPKMLS